MKRTKKSQAVKPHTTGEWLKVESLDLEAQGIAHTQGGKVMFIEDALPGEWVQVSVTRSKKNWEMGTMLALRRESSQRVQPRCPHFGTCGGCKMQHLHVGSQVATKQRALENALWHLGKVNAEHILRPVEGPTWGYRYRARLSIWCDTRLGKVLIGFHERKSSLVADMDSCEVLPPHISAMLVPLRELIAAMDRSDRFPQIELAVGDAVTALVLRHLDPMSKADLERLRKFGEHHQVQWWLQAKGPDDIRRLDEADGSENLAYAMPEFGIHLPFLPTDFTQVNPHINRVLVTRALRLLDVRKDERVIDWFCGLGNFTLPLATQAREVLGIEGSEALVRRSRENAVLNGLSAKSTFIVRNLFEITPVELATFGNSEKWLIDPPRDGAFALSQALVDLQRNPLLAPTYTAPKRIVYVSCNPATLARDAGLLVHEAGYHCSAAGTVNMFPHTAHVESMAVFEKN